MRLATGLLLILALAGCQRAGAPRAGTTGVDSLVLERTRCYGSCPAYRLSIASTGAVQFRSHNPGDTLRTASDWVDTAAFRLLTDEAARIGFRGLPNEIAESRLCGRMASDASSVIVTLFGAQGNKRVEDYLGCLDGPRPLRDFQDRIDSVAGSRRWTRPAAR